MNLDIEASLTHVSGCASAVPPCTMARLQERNRTVEVTIMIAGSKARRPAALVDKCRMIELKV